MTVSSQGGEPRFKLSGVSVCLCVQQARHWKITVSYSEPHLPRCSCVPAVLALFLMLRSASLSVCVLASAKQLKQNFELSLCVCWSCPKYVDVWKGLCQVAKPIFFGRGLCTWYFQSTVLFSPQTFSGTETGWSRDEARNGAKNCHNDSCEGLDRLGGTG